MEKVRFAPWTARPKLVWSCGAGHRAPPGVQRMWVPREPSGLSTRLQEKVTRPRLQDLRGWALGHRLAPVPRMSCTYTWTPSTLEITGSLFLLASLQRPLLRKLSTALALKEAG